MTPARRGAPVRRLPSCVAASVVVAVGLAACGVEPQARPEPVPSGRLPQASSPPRDDTSAGARTRIWAVRDQRLVPVFVSVPPSGVQARLEALLSLGQEGQQLGTAVVRGTRVESVMQRGDLVAVTLSAEFRRAPQKEIPLALAQVVLTVTETPGVTRVEVRADGTPIGLVDQSGRAVSRPLLRADFTGLVEGGRTD